MKTWSLEFVAVLVLVFLLAFVTGWHDKELHGAKLWQQHHQCGPKGETKVVCDDGKVYAR